MLSLSETTPMKNLIAAIAVLAFASSALAQDLVGSFPAEGGAITVTASGGTVMAAGIDLNSAGGNLIPAGGDAAPFTFLLADTANQVTYGNLGTSVDIADGASLTLTAGVQAGGDDIVASWGMGATPVAFPVTAAGGVVEPVGPTFCDTSGADVCFDFDAGSVEGATLVGDGEIRAEGGFEGGFLAVTDAANGQRGTVILPDVGGGGQFVFGGRTGGANAAHHIDNLEASIVDGRVQISALLRVGGGTDSPADGFSFNFVRPGDPLLEGTGDGYAGIAGEDNLPEEGSTTGLSIGFDEWQSGPAPADSSQFAGEGAADVIGLSLRVDGVIVGQASLPTLNGAIDDPTSLQTGPNDGSELGFAVLTIDAPIEGADLSNVNVTWKGADVNFVPEPASGLMALVSFLALGVMRRRRK